MLPIPTIKNDSYAGLWPCQIDEETGETGTGKNDSSELSGSTLQCDYRLGSSLTVNSYGGAHVAPMLGSASVNVGKEAEESFGPLKVSLEAILYCLRQ